MSALEAPQMSAALPELTVFDLDACLWDKEMFEMSEIPKEKVMGDLNGRGSGVIGVMSGRDQISLHEGALVALQEHADGKFPGMRVALASSANTPFAVQVGRTSLTMLEVLPGLSVWDILMRDWEGRDVNQIGRQPPLSPNKAATHFPRLREATGIRFDRMLFFDDCNCALLSPPICQPRVALRSAHALHYSCAAGGDHCGQVSSRCKEDNGKGVVAVRTPHGLGVTEFRRGLADYAAARNVNP